MSRIFRPSIRFSSLLQLRKHSPLQLLRKVSFNCQDVDNRWNQVWYEFHSRNESENADFRLVLPPPNVTGDLHLGHCLTAFIQDALVRWRLQNGSSVSWVPGFDHSGVGAVSIALKSIKEPSPSQNDVLSKISSLSDEYKERMAKELRKMGLLLQWDKSIFTLDPIHSAVVNEAFVELYDKGFIKRDSRHVNWCSVMKSVISDIEMTHKTFTKKVRIELPDNDFMYVGCLSTFYYRVKDSDEKIPVSTTRLHTMLGDVGVAVNPNDERYANLIGKCCVHPMFPERSLPIIADDLVNIDFGTGAVKLTPHHSSVDFDICKRNNIPLGESMLSSKGTIADGLGDFSGLSLSKATGMIIGKLKEMEDWIGSKNHEVSIPFCSRTNALIEPKLQEQWFVKTAQMCEEALAAVRTGKIRIVPENQVTLWNQWLENPRDWCISRQIPWGHRIPAFQSPSGEWIIARNLEKAREKVDGKMLVQDADVLDTWFSSSVYPLTAAGWPDKTITKPPLSILETGSDILFFWAARMSLLCHTLTNHQPYETLLLHGLVRDKEGQKMSKSKGNVVAPSETVKAPDLPQSCGSDALRLTLLSLPFTGDRLIWNSEHLKGYSRLCNKIMNVVHFASVRIASLYQRDLSVEWNSLPSPVELDVPSLQETKSPRKLAEIMFTRFLMLRLVSTFNTVRTNQEKDFNLNLSVLDLEALWMDFSGIFLNLVLPFRGKDVSLPNQALLQSLLASLRLMHPFAPNITQEIFTDFLTSSENLGIPSNLYPKLIVDQSPELFSRLSELDEYFSSEEKQVFEQVIKSIRQTMITARRFRHEYTRFTFVVPDHFRQDHPISALYISSLTPLIARSLNATETGDGTHAITVYYNNSDNPPLYHSALEQSKDNIGELYAQHDITTKAKPRKSKKMFHD